ncbi:pseudouridine synthase [Lactarius quietus]|nr:pseudouridine synthase [Lactarius quietus]
MPKSPSLPLSGLFGVVKPSGPTSMHIVNQLKKLVNNSRLFVHKEKLEKAAGKKRSRKDNVKMGQGGTLDPLADGVLVVGVGKGTKRLNDFLDCTKEYRTTCLLGCETDTYDSEGARIRTAPWRHVTREKLEDALVQFRGEIQQAPPMHVPSPFPRIPSLEPSDDGSDHSYRWPENVFTAEQKKALARSLSGVKPESDDALEGDPSEAAVPEEVPTAFVLRMRVSGGTYVRSIVHDLAHALGSRDTQKDYALEPEEGDRRCVPWEVFEAADEDGWTAWEREVLDKLVVVDGIRVSPSRIMDHPFSRLGG